MAFDRLFRASLYLTLLLATLLLTIDTAQFGRLGFLYPLAALAAATTAFLTVDSDVTRGIPRDLANFLALIGAILGLLEWYSDPTSLLQAFGHAFVYFQLVYYFLRKDVEVDWILFLLSLVEAVIGVLINHSELIGFLVFAWSISSLWTFGLFFLRRQAVRGGPPAGVTVTPPPVPGDPYPGLVNAAFIFSMFRIAVATLLLGGLIFFIMPRWTVRGMNRFGTSPTEKHLTGFSREVKLGQMGEILENESIVLSVEFSDENNQVVTPDPDILLRGLTLTQYDRKKWTREETDGVSIDSLRRWPLPNVPIISQRYKMEAMDSDVLFSVRPILRVSTTLPGEVALNRNDGSLFRRDSRDDFGENALSRPNKFDYTVVSAAGVAKAQPLETFNVPNKGLTYTHLPNGLEKPLSEICAPILAKLRPEVRNSPLEQARALERHLRDGEYTYTLKMRIVDPDIDPVLDFLKNRKEGHCEYFASALTLMCRSQGIPARLVNGFKGGDWDELGRVLHVREKHAHSWVEVLVSDRPRSPIWETLDPTPSRQRSEVVAQVGASTMRYRYLTDKIRTQWIFYVIGFDAERQENKIYSPIRESAARAARQSRLLRDRLKDAASWLYFEDVGQFFSVRGFFVSCTAMLVVAGLARLASLFISRMTGRSRSDGSDEDSRDSTVAFYHRLMRIMNGLGIDRPPSETPREFARRASLALEGLPLGMAFENLPSNIVEAFYAKRFGHHEPGDEFLNEVDSRLGALEESLARPPAG